MKQKTRSNRVFCWMWIASAFVFELLAFDDTLNSKTAKVERQRDPDHKNQSRNKTFHFSPLPMFKKLICINCK